LQACRDGLVFGTVSLCFDSDFGLAADALYRPELDCYRAAGARLVELTRLAIDPRFGSKEVLGALFHLAYIHGALLRSASDVFIEVNPRHVMFYERMLHFRRVGDCKWCERVGALAQLLHVEVAHVREQIAEHGGHRKPARSSLYPYFFSKEEEKGLPARILHQTIPNVSPSCKVASVSLGNPHVSDGSAIAQQRLP